MLHTVLKRRLLTAANLIATMMAALASCDDTDPRRLDPAMCAPVLDEGLAPAAAGPPRWEPPPYPFARPPGTQTESGLLLPENFNTTSYYPIEVGTGAHFRLQFMIGQEISELHHVYVYVLVEGRPVEVLAEGADSTPRIVVDIASGLADVEVEIPPEALQPGLNQVDLAQVFHIGDRYLFGRANSFTVANGTAAYAAPPETELPPGEFAPGAIAQVFRMGEGSTAEDELFFRLYRSSHGPLPDPLQLVPRLQPTSPWSTCAGAEDAWWCSRSTTRTSFDSGTTIES